MHVSFNSLGPSDAIWRLRSGSTLAQVMAWCRTAPSHYLNQCWLIIGEVLWYSPLSNLPVSARASRYLNQCWFIIGEVLWYSPLSNLPVSARASRYLNQCWFIIGEVLWYSPLSNLPVSARASRYLNQCWFIIGEVLWYSPLSNLPVSAWVTILYNEFQKYTFKIAATYPRDQWVNSLVLSRCGCNTKSILAIDILSTSYETALQWINTIRSNVWNVSIVLCNGSLPSVDIRSLLLCGITGPQWVNSSCPGDLYTSENGVILCLDPVFQLFNAKPLSKPIWTFREQDANE